SQWGAFCYCESSHKRLKFALSRLETQSFGSERPLLTAISTGRCNTLFFLERWSEYHEVSSPHIFHGQTEVGYLEPLATRRVDEFDWAAV
ncbi:MAG: hypothetical protein WBV62_03980, partial [Roseobacter sp.]